MIEKYFAQKHRLLAHLIYKVVAFYTRLINVLFLRTSKANIIAQILLLQPKTKITCQNTLNQLYSSFLTIFGIN